MDRNVSRGDRVDDNSRARGDGGGGGGASWKQRTNVIYLNLVPATMNTRQRFTRCRDIVSVKSIFVLCGSLGLVTPRNHSIAMSSLVWKCIRFAVCLQSLWETQHFFIENMECEIFYLLLWVYGYSPSKKRLVPNTIHRMLETINMLLLTNDPLHYSIIVAIQKQIYPPPLPPPPPSHPFSPLAHVSKRKPKRKDIICV